MRDLRVTLVQTATRWHDPAANRALFTERLAALEATDLVVLPEMFSTGFTMASTEVAETMDGPTVAWLRERARDLDAGVCGSVVIEDGGRHYNRFLLALPDGALHHYDKRHLFRMAGEHNRYAPGSKRVVVAWRDWRIKLEVCYDLRFPVFCRNRGDYDLLLTVANWPAARASHWRTLLQARAIENLACVVGVNRIGRDANGLEYQGDSMAIDARGGIVADLRDRPTCETVTLEAAPLQHYREVFPTHLDADRFELPLD